jgi:hypothetical protein
MSTRVLLVPPFANPASGAISGAPPPSCAIPCEDLPKPSVDLRCKHRLHGHPHPPRGFYDSASVPPPRRSSRRIPESQAREKKLASPAGVAERSMTGDVDEEVGDNDENALDWGDGAAWWDSHCESAVSSEFVKDSARWGFICESSAITSAGRDVGVSRGL